MSFENLDDTDTDADTETDADDGSQPGASSCELKSNESVNSKAKITKYNYQTHCPCMHVRICTILTSGGVIANLSRDTNRKFGLTTREISDNSNSSSTTNLKFDIDKLSWFLGQTAWFSLISYNSFSFQILGWNEIVCSILLCQ